MIYRGTITKINVNGVYASVPRLGFGMEVGPMVMPDGAVLAVGDPVVLGQVGTVKEDLVIINRTAGPLTLTLDDLDGVIITTPTAGDGLFYDGTNWVNQAPASSSLDDLSDVVLTEPRPWDTLVYTGEQWINRSLDTELLLLDTFSRTDGASWGTPDIGAAYVNISLASHTLSVAGGNGVMTCTAADNEAIQQIGSHKGLNSRTTLRGLSVSATPSGGELLQGLYLRASDLYSFWTWVALVWLDDGTAEIYVEDDSDGVLSSGVAVPGITSSQPVDMAVEFIGDTLKIWAALSSTNPKDIVTTVPLVEVTCTNNRYGRIAVDNLTTTGLSVPISGRWSSIEIWDFTNTLSKLNDVSVPTATDGDFLRYNGDIWTDSTANLNDLSDVVIAGPSNSQIFVYDSGGPHWENADPSTINGKVSPRMATATSSTASPSGFTAETSMMSITAAGLTIGRTYKVHSTTMISVSVASTEVVMRLRSGTTTGGGQVSADTSVFDGTGRKAKMFEHHFTASATTHSFNVTAARQAGTGTITHDPSSTAQSQMYVDYVSG